MDQIVIQINPQSDKPAETEENEDVLTEQKQPIRVAEPIMQDVFVGANGLFWDRERHSLFITDGLARKVYR